MTSLNPTVNEGIDANTEALIIRIGSWDVLCYNYNKEPQNSIIGNYLCYNYNKDTQKSIIML